MYEFLSATRCPVPETDVTVGDEHGNGAPMSEMGSTK
jgi:hypothetical protein